MNSDKVAVVSTDHFWRESRALVAVTNSFCCILSNTNHHLSLSHSSIETPFYSNF